MNLKSYLAEGVSSLPTLGVKMVRIWGFGRTDVHVEQKLVTCGEVLIGQKGFYFSLRPAIPVSV